VRAALAERAEVAPFDRLGEALASGPVMRLFNRSGTAIASVPVASVPWFDADGDDVIAHAKRAWHVLTPLLARLEARLDPRRFTRIHRAYIVNLDQVTAFRRHGKGGMTAAHHAHLMRLLGASLRRLPAAAACNVGGVGRIVSC
jgi:two-component system LytT family response regulator